MATDGGVKINGVRHIVAVAFGCLAMLLCSGVIYGYNALLPLLIQQDAFSSLCTSSSSSSTSTSSGLLYDCASQKDRLNLLYTLSITCLYTAVLPFGFIVGRIGPRWMLTLSGALFVLGAVFMSLGPTCGGPCWSSGLIIFGLVSPGFFMSCLSLGKLFPRSSAHVTTLVIGCFELSTGTFWVLGEIVNSKNLSLSWSETWYIFAGVCGFIAVACAIALPPQEESE
jgi:MFS family permease